MNHSWSVQRIVNCRTILFVKCTSKIYRLLTQTLITTTKHIMYIFSSIDPILQSKTHFPPDVLLESGVDNLDLLKERNKDSNFRSEPKTCRWNFSWKLHQIWFVLAWWIFRKDQKRKDQINFAINLITNQQEELRHDNTSQFTQ